MTKLIEWLNNQLEKSQHELQCREDAVKAWSGSDAEWESLPGAPPKQERTATAEREARIAAKAREDIDRINELIAIVIGEEKQSLDELRQLNNTNDMRCLVLYPTVIFEGENRTRTDYWEVLEIIGEDTYGKGPTPLAAVRAAAEKLRGAR